MKSLLRRTVPVLAFAAVTAFGSGAHAQSANRRFQRYMNDAVAAYQAGNADAAIEALQHAYEIRQVPLILFNIARAHEQAGRLASAIEYYDRFIAANPDPSQVQTARDARVAAQAALDARNHPSNNTASAAPPASSGPPAGPTPHPAESHPRRFTALHGALMGGGAALAIAGGICGIFALTTANDFRTSPMDPAVRAGLQDRGYGLAWSADIGVGVGVAAFALGTVLYLIQDTRQNETPSRSVLARREVLR
jgi:tetratricopeptide (TPR) repeat protein